MTTHKVKDPSRFMVLNKRCDQCPFSKNQTIVPEQRLAEIKKSLNQTGSPFHCHKTYDQDLVCRGYYDTEPNLIVALARRLDRVEFVALDTTPAIEDNTQ